MPAHPTILVVDDQPELLSGLQLTLEFAGYQVLTAVDGHLALTILRRQPVELVLADIAMPQLNGYQLYEQVRADPALSRLPVLMLTAEAHREQIVAAAQAGVNGYVIKPFTAAILKEKIDKVLGARAASAA